ncbi:MAG: mobile mystery protein B [Gemmatimonadota bacterium]|nr:mobile mystery protein B [Gemmatimonadota bacterium]
MKHLHDEPGNTPLDEDETEGLIPPHLTSRAELNQWEANNIASAHEWGTRQRSDVLDVAFLGELHRRMFGMTWKWAGGYRKSDKSLSPHRWTQVPELMRNLIDNTHAQYDASSKASADVDEIAVRFHHEIVRIHPWPKGNGRHGRLATDLLLRQWGRPPFTWAQGADPARASDVRARYIHALRQADAGDFSELRALVREE